MLASTYYIDSDNEDVIRFAENATSKQNDEVLKAVELYYAVRDGFQYNPYRLTLDKEHYRASYVLKAGEGFCIQKAILLAASARALGIPAKLGFANVINHLATRKLLDIMKTDLFVFHGYTSLLLKENWVKATPAFDIKLCEKFGVKPLEFDGLFDSVFHPHDLSGARHMEYVHDYGLFDDLPFEMMLEEFRKYYPHMVEHFLGKEATGINGDFRTEQ